MERTTELNTIERILAAEEALVPSSGFVSAVMERVHQESVALPPIPFPWKRAIPGIALAAGVFGWGAFEMLRDASAMAVSPATIQISTAVASSLESTGWVALALAASWFGWRISRRLFERAGLI